MDIKNIASGISLDPAERGENERGQIQLLAQQFEAMLMTQMLREMRKSMLDEGEEDDAFGYGNDALTDTGDIELGNALSRQGGVGLAETMLKAFEQQVAAMTDRSQTPSSDAGRDLTPLVAPMQMFELAPKAVNGLSAAEVTAPAPISSRFGWRHDPVTGAARFHQGIDIAVAYGRDVKAAAEGTVAFAGIQGGYGHTVVINHHDGRQTRYAHLSEPLVKAGETVQEGQIVGKSGNSGRSTGPHLHFEVLVNGTPVDPSGMAES